MTLDIDMPAMRGLGPVRISREALDGHPAYAALLAGAATTNACPVWITPRGLERIEPPDDAAAALARIDDVDPAAHLARHWGESCPLCGCRDALPRGPSVLIPAIGSAEPPQAVAARSGHRRGHLAIVPAARPADALTVLGWMGACNRGADVAELSAVLRSWEDRFGAVLVNLDDAVLWLSVAAPPRTQQQCLHVAAEHFSFCPDVDRENPRPLQTYAGTLLNAPAWRFWWD